MTTIHVTRLLVMVLLFAVPAIAQAQDARPPSAEDRRLSAILLDRSAVAYRLGRYEEAIVMLEDAYVLSREPILLYNLGRAYEGAQDSEHAVDAYRRFLETSTTEAEVEPVRAAIERLELAMEIERLAAEELAERERVEAIRRAAEDARAEREARAEAEREQRERDAEAARVAAERRALAPWPWTIAGVGAATIIAGSVVGAVALERREEAVHEEVQAIAVQRLQDARDLASGANVAFVLGGVILAGGVSWGVYELVRGDDGEHADREVRVEVSPTVGGIAVRGTF